MKIFLTLFLIFISLHIHGQEYYFIDAENGLNVRSEGNLSSKKVTKIRFGAMVEKIADTDIIFSVSDNGKLIKGKFVKIKHRKEYLSTEDVEGYVFDGYLKKQINDDLISITKIEKGKYTEFLKVISKENHNPEKISNLDSIKTLLTGRVTWGKEVTVMSMTLNNRTKLLFNSNAVDFGFAEGGSSGYYPEHDILVLEGGHGSDVCFSIKTGETDVTIGNPEYMVSSPKNSYRLNGYFGGQECISYFFQKNENGRFVYLSALNWDYDICTFKEFHWINENEFIYIKMKYGVDAENGIEEYYMGEIREDT